MSFLKVAIAKKKHSRDVNKFASKKCGGQLAGMLAGWLACLLGSRFVVLIIKTMAASAEYYTPSGQQR